MKSSSPSTIVSFGEILWDLFPEGPKLGGAPANFACHAALCGARSHMLTATGADARGDDARTILGQIGVDTTLMQQVPDAMTGVVEVTVDTKGKPQYRIKTGTAWDFIGNTTAVSEIIASADAVYFGTLGQHGEVSRATLHAVLEQAKARGILRVLDVNLRAPFYTPELIRASIAECTVLKLSDEEWPEVSTACGLPAGTDPEHGLSLLQKKYGLTLVTMTCGAEGAVIQTADTYHVEPGVPVQVVDTVGAGDSFTAAMIVSLLRGEDVKTMAANACATAAAVCAHAGALPPLAHA